MYGARRFHEELTLRRGVEVGHGAVAPLMRRAADATRRPPGASSAVQRSAGSPIRRVAPLLVTGGQLGAQERHRDHGGRHRRGGRRRDAARPFVHRGTTSMTSSGSGHGGRSRQRGRRRSRPRKRRGKCSGRTSRTGVAGSLARNKRVNERPFSYERLRRATTPTGSAARTTIAAFDFQSNYIQPGDVSIGSAPSTRISVKRYSGHIATGVDTDRSVTLATETLRRVRLLYSTRRVR